MITRPTVAAKGRAKYFFLGVVLIAATSLATEAAKVPAKPIAREGASLFADDFGRNELGPSWRVTTPTFVVKDGALKATHTQASHSAVGRVDVGRQNVIVEFRFRLEGARVNAVLNDPKYKESHGGHICRVELSSNQIRLADDKERLRHDIVEMQKDPARKAEAAARVAGRLQTLPINLEHGRWYRLRMEVIEDRMRVSLDGRAIGYLRSSGIAHPTKREFYFAVSGKDAFFDDVKIWEASTL